MVVSIPQAGFVGFQDSQLESLKLEVDKFQSRKRVS